MQRIIVIFMATLALAVHAADEPKAKPAKEDNFFNRAAKVIGQDAKTVAHAAKQAGKDIGHAASKAAKEVASAFKAGDQKTGKEGKENSK
jgi:lysylphosphatidylglycerol synthetase-like protein (DUF2156 family)